MHWGVKKQTDPMLEAGQDSSTNQLDVQDGSTSGQSNERNMDQTLTQGKVISFLISYC